MKLFRLSLVLLFISPSFYSFGQSLDNDKISGIFSGVSFERFAQMLEARSTYRIYYNPSDVDSLQININAFQNSLEQILNDLFTGTDLQFSIDHQNRVFITKEKKLNLALSGDFFLQKTEKIPEEQKEKINLEKEERVFAKNRLWHIGSDQHSRNGDQAQLRGTVLGYESKEPIVGALVYTREMGSRTITGEMGEYTITLPKGRHTLIVQSFGTYQEQRHIHLMGNGTLNIELDDNIISLAEVVISSEKSANIERPEMGLESISVQSLKKLPAVLGEVDVLKAILTLPGVKTVGEASVGFNVRGGAADQNLILFNQATIYNPTHLFGLFSAFNPDMIQSVDLYKAGIPVQYGGRLSSVLDIKAKFGNEEKISGGGGIGLMTSRLFLEGPVNEKTTFALGGRTTYSNWLFGYLDEDSGFSNSRASFQDLNLNIKHRINEKNEITLSSYLSEDAFKFDRDTTFNYANKNINLGWLHYFSDRFESEVTLGHDNYRFGILGEQNPLNAFRFGFEMNQSHLRVNLIYDLNDQHRFTFGMNNVYFNLSPGNLLPEGEESIVLEDRVNRERALETSFYFGDDFEVNPRLSINYGIRYVLYNYLGPNWVNNYPAGSLKSETTLIDQTSYGRGKLINTYQGPEIRLSARYSLDNFTSVKVGYNTMRQHIHMLTNTSAISPTDTWKMSDPNLAPQIGDQLAIGYFKNFNKNTLETSVEIYGRRLKNLLDFKSGATLILNNAVEQDILNTDGRAYGIELMAKKAVGKLNGWLSYTYSRSLMRTSLSEQGEKINKGDFYPSNFDQPHDIMLAANFEFTKRFNSSLNSNYSTGRPITLPIAKFEYFGSERVFYSDRNAHRIPDYFRIDLSFNVEGNHKIRKLAHASWSFGVYNLLGRSNPYSVYFTTINGILQGYQLSIFANPIPFVTYNFQF